jgi:hypothetical protein
MPILAFAFTLAWLLSAIIVVAILGGVLLLARWVWSPNPVPSFVWKVAILLLGIFFLVWCFRSGNGFVPIPV